MIFLKKSDARLINQNDALFSYLQIGNSNRSLNNFGLYVCSLIEYCAEKMKYYSSKWLYMHVSLKLKYLVNNWSLTASRPIAYLLFSTSCT